MMSPVQKYDFKKIEAKWQKEWKKKGIYEPDILRAKKPFYSLMMFPYPSAEGLHVGNMYAFTGSDIYGRFKRMQGYDVFEPIGLDGFGIHSENYAIKIGAHPMRQAKVSEKRFYKQLEAIGNGFAWKEKVETYDPAYYRWTQWLFVQMFKHGLAYRKKQPVNWCPSCKTVLADEQAESGKCERCGTAVVKKDLEQWFFKITEYAERLLRDVSEKEKGLDWSEKVKIAQKNWIGKSEGATIRFEIVSRINADSSAQIRADKNPRISATMEVFTTRPDTLFGATYMVLAPEHPIIENCKLKIENWDAVKDYVKKAAKKSDEERIAEGKEKSGVELKGVKAINPATKEKIPVWVADYVLAGYGTGAIMAVPAHDERDYEFAKKFKMPIREVVAPLFTSEIWKDAWRASEPETKRLTVVCLVKHWSENKYLFLHKKESADVGAGTIVAVAGGVDEGENMAAAGAREIREETGYNAVFKRPLGAPVYYRYYSTNGKQNRIAELTPLYYELKNGVHEEISDREKTLHENVWLSENEIGKYFEGRPFNEIFWNRLKKNESAFTGHGILTNSGRFNGMDSKHAGWEITNSVGGTRKSQYRLRDWLISRQRYWGPPIPMIQCGQCAANGIGEREDMPGWYAVPEKDLPVKLPFVKDFRPTGSDQSPLASVKSFYEVKCPKCKAKARRETDVSDTFLDSAWYYLRYIDPKNRTQPFDKAKAKKWFPVDMYTGGAEHSVLHLLYVRFVAKALHDWGEVAFKEPFKKFRAHGLIVREGAKMSKSKGNIVNPDAYIKKFGADTLRMYLMFLSPFEQGGDFRDQGVVGVTRFLERFYRFVQHSFSAKEKGDATPARRALHKTIKKVSGDIENLQYNTAISALMILLHSFDEHAKEVTKEMIGDFAKLLAPFAPHVAEEVWRGILGKKNSIHKEPWPEYNPAFVKDDAFTLVIQVNGKTRDTVEAPTGISESNARALALGREKIKALTGGKAPKRVIYVPGRLVSIVV